MNIRIATINDRKRINELFTQMIEFINEKNNSFLKSEYEEGYLDKFFEDSKNFIVVAEINDIVVGYLSCEGYPNDSYLYLDDFCVDKNYRKMKVGTKLIEYAINFSKQNNYDKLRLHVDVNNDIAQKFYSKFNFLPIKRKDNRIEMIKEINKKYVKVIDGLKSNANGFEYKLNEINISQNWNPKTLDPEKMGGFNFGTEDKILRWLHRGDIIYDVIIPENAEVILCDSEKGIYIANKIIITNPRTITDDMVLELYKKTTLSNKIIAQVLVTLLWRKRKEISKYIIKDRVNLNNIDEILNEFVSYAGIDNLNSESGNEIYEMLQEIKSDLYISQSVDKEPYIKKLTPHNVINLTGQSGSGKSYYAKQFKDNNDYLVIDTDDIFSEERFQKSNGINKELGIYFRKKYDILPNLYENFDQIYNDILDYTKKYNKTIIIDCAQFHCIKDINNLKGTIIVLRTCIDTCYKRCIQRYKEQNKNITDEEIIKYSNKKLPIYKWYKQTNKFLEKLNELEKSIYKIHL